ncbi:pancreatic lipase-related protein 2-like [Nymphalis io]|uniref:pancreatic lipase-related protein 2-like n=1 Tax=Inachis io TaxID=171585 RepID=UPI002168687B|nr:pancreatic lipase-related protein 2-like [Nymphalis io]
MKTLLFLLCISVCSATAVPLKNAEINYPRFIKYSDYDGVMHTLDLEEQPDTTLLEDIYRNPDNNRYLLYTRDNPLVSQTLGFNNTNSIILSKFDARKPIVVIVHGWLSDKHANSNIALTEVFLRKSNVNVIVMEWRRLASSNYVTATAGVPAVGRRLGEFLKFLHSVTGAPYETMHLIGFSLGAHVVGNSGRQLGGKVARVTGLDPAGPLWNLNRDRLRSSDGIYVEAIHTDGGVLGLGIGSAVADADFFPNGGNSQPGCLTSFCNHERAWQLFASSVTYNHFLGRECSNMLQVSLNSCRGKILNMGNDDLRKKGTGLYRLNTQRSYPY